MKREEDNLYEFDKLMSHNLPATNNATKILLIFLLV